MIPKQYLGKTIEDIPETDFEPGFDFPFLMEGRNPSLVLASTLIVPERAHDWILAYQYCGGFACYSKYAAILPLEIKPSIQISLESIVQEDFAGDNNLDWFESAGFGEELQVQIKHQYRKALSDLGLTCSDQLLSELTQALYPVDATEENLKILSSTEVNWDEFDNTGFVIYIVGQNCD